MIENTVQHKPRTQRLAAHRTATELNDPINFVLIGNVEINKGDIIVNKNCIHETKTTHKQQQESNSLEMETKIAKPAEEHKNKQDT